MLHPTRTSPTSAQGLQDPRLGARSPFSLTFALHFLFLPLLWSRAGRTTVDVPGELGGTTSSSKCLFQA